MFFHHPEAVAALQRMAGKALGGGAPKRADARVFARIRAVCRLLGWELLVGWLTLLFAGFLNGSAALHGPAWRDFFLAGVVMVTSAFLHQRLASLLYSSPTAMVLYHLPVAGGAICRWGRAEVLWHSIWQLPRMMIVAYAWLGFPALVWHWPRIAACGILLWFVMLASVQLRHQRLLPRLYLAHVWNVTLLLWVVYSVCLIWSDRPALRNYWPAWTEHICVLITWLHPPQWAMHGASHPVSALLALACLGLGAWRWMRLPAEWGPGFDKFAPQADKPAPPPVTSESNDSEDAAALALPLEAPTPSPFLPADIFAEFKGTLAHETLALSHGWIESLVLAVLRGRDRMLFAVLSNPDPGWTRRWARGVRINLALQGILLAVVVGAGRAAALDLLEPWLWIIPMAVAMALSFPASNTIPAAMMPRPLGQHLMPFFAGLPVRVTDLVRVSTRITLGRMAGWLLLVIPTLVSQCLILGMPRLLPALVVGPVVFGLLWTVLRPVLVYFRLQQAIKPVRGAWLGHLVMLSVNFCLLVVLVISAVWGIIMTFTFTSLPWYLLWLPVTLLLVAGLCAQAIFAIFHLHVRRQKEDWLIQQPGVTN